MFKFLLNLGYLGVFLINLISSSTIFFPIPGFAAITVGGAILNPWIVGILGGLGLGLGELTGYYVGIGSEKLIKRKYAGKLKRIRSLFKRYHGWLVIFVFALTPLPFDFVGLFAGSTRYPLSKFLAATLIGKIARSVLIALAGSSLWLLLAQWIGI